MNAPRIKLPRWAEQALFGIALPLGLVLGVVRAARRTKTHRQIRRVERFLKGTP